MSTQYSLLLCVLNILVFAVLEITGTNKIPGLIAFGDSTVDAGNNNQVLTLIKANFPPYGQDFEGGKPTGRFCNGRLPTDFLSEMLGIKRSIPAYLDPAFGIEDFATGVTFASSGTGFDVATSTILAVIPLSKELDYFKEYLEKLTSFLGNDTAAETARESLYIISIGTNDFVLNYFTVPGRSFQFTVDEYQDFLLGTARNFLIELHSLGARKIVIVGLPPNDCLPIVKTLDLVPVRPSLEEIKKASIDYNVKLQNLVWSLSIELEGIKLVYADIYNPLLHIIQNPNLYGFENAEEGCCATGTVEFGFPCIAGNALSCPDPGKYVFFDAVHPTEKVYGILANTLINTTISQLIK
ncbi:GDSL esterase/lipase At2g04570-like [Papaver somniferum]|uniref:GDSL esterase/lipase At2g04570-like n=1 Tax=Papaver somniferum TaxID=3469 RepID=UPI000E6FEA1F|nr:GDSL esterase/lipase At2g04570-like [Papaver somniferum]